MNTPAPVPGHAPKLTPRITPRITPGITPRLTVITLGVSDIRASIDFYEALGFARKFRATGDAVAFFETGGPVLGLFP